MRVSVDVILRFVGFACLGVASATGAAGADFVNEDRWVPSAAIFSGVGILGSSAAVHAIDTDGVDVRPPVNGTDVDVSAFVAVDLELMTPSIPVPGGPRLFVSGEVIPMFGSTRNPAKEGNPTGVEGPPQPDLPPGQLPLRGYVEGALLGQGSSASITFNPISYAAGLGFSFPVEWLGRKLRIKPSVEWTWFEMDFEGKVANGDCLPRTLSNGIVVYECETFQGPSDPTPTPGFLRVTELQSNTTRSYNAIGPGFEFEMETGRAGPFAHSLFIGTRAYAVLGDRSVVLQETMTNSDPIGDRTTIATWTYEIDPWMIRAFVGFRLQWAGRGD